VPSDDLAPELHDTRLRVASAIITAENTGNVFFLIVLDCIKVELQNLLSQRYKIVTFEGVASKAI
jgi:hypothetical protein